MIISTPLSERNLCLSFRNGFGPLLMDAAHRSNFNNRIWYLSSGNYFIAIKVTISFIWWFFFKKINRRIFENVVTHSIPDNMIWCRIRMETYLSYEVYCIRCWWIELEKFNEFFFFCLWMYLFTASARSRFFFSSS